MPPPSTCAEPCVAGCKRDPTNSRTSSLSMTSKMPSHASSSQSPGTHKGTVVTSGTATTLQASGAWSGGLKWKSPSARLTASAPSTRGGPPPRGPGSTEPPAARIRLSSSSRCGLWSSEHISCFPPDVQSTARESPACAKCTQYSSGFGRVTIAATTVEPLRSSAGSSWRSLASTALKATWSSSSAVLAGSVPRRAKPSSRSPSKDAPAMAHACPPCPSSTAKIPATSDSGGGRKRKMCASSCVRR
mmetsp:Transcript_67973/g.208266  ORF Transcript_67973/g.208266 Transcript_67973/m.208266 type:complete len:246 (-) Transcript_67973:146-883(-)